MWDLFKINNKDTKTDFTHSSGVSKVDFELVNTHWVNYKRVFLFKEDTTVTFFVRFFENNYFQSMKNTKTGTEIIFISL